MPQQIINNAESGLAVRTKINANFTELYALVTGGGSTFDPKTIPALTLWLDASDSSTLFDASVGGSNVTTQDAPVTRWKDKSGNNFDAIQTVENSKPVLKTAFINGKNCIRFDGINDWMDSTVNFNNYQSFTVFIISKINSSGSVAHVSFGANINNAKGAAIGQGFDNVGMYNSIYLKEENKLSQWLAIGVYKNLKFTVFGNGQKGTTTSMQFYSSFIQEFPTSIGIIGTFNDGTKYGFSNADYCEILIYGTELTSIQRQQIELYLNQKWAIF